MSKIALLLLITVGLCDKLKLTLEELEQFDGRNGKIYLACAGIIFDVTDSPAYQPKGGYSMFAGRDASVALAKYSFDKKWLTMRPEDADLSEDQIKSIEHWKEFYTEKYPIVGELVASKIKEDI